MSEISKIRTLYFNSQSGTTVDLVRNNLSGQEYVIKQILYLDNPIHRAIFDKEIGALKKIRHSDNIVKLLDHKHGRSSQTGQAKGFISLEYVDGDTLQNMCAQITSITDKYNIIKQLINALRCSHENGIIHRDVNPRNIMLTVDLYVKLIDFGICKIKGASQRGTTYQYATNKYAAPEVCYHSENATERSDIYSLGSVIYFLFTKCEPAVPAEIENAIQRTNGMDPSLKDILIKMTAYDAKDRFENVVDLEMAFAPLYSKYLSNNEVYCVSMDSSKITYLRRNNLVKSYKSDEQLLNDDIPMNFSDSSVRCEMNGENLIYKFDGINYSMDCLFERDIFQVTNIHRLQSFVRERNRKISLPLIGRIIFGKTYSKDVIQNNNFQLSNRIEDHMQMLCSQKNIDFEYDSSFGFWQDFIKIMIEDAQKQALRFNYRNYKDRDGHLYFKLISDSCTDHESLTSETKFIYESKNKGKSRIIEIGSFEGFADDGSTLIIKPSQQKKKSNIPPKGTFFVDYRKEISQYRKQERALDEFRRDETNNNNGLKGIFVGLEPPSTFPTSTSIKFFDENIDDAQQRAVCKVLDAKDIALIQGPPGTGKTNVIVEVIRQVIQYNKRNPIVAQKVLIVSQSHAAVDKILEDLDSYLNGINAIRIGHDDEKLSELAKEKYSLDTRKKLWIQNIIAKSNNQLSENLKKLKISPEDFNDFVDALENATISNNSEADVESYKTITDSFYERYDLDESNLFLKQQITCRNWIKQLSETRDIEEYFIKNATIVLGTCSGFVSNPFINDAIFDYVIVDEAAKATLPEIMVSLVKANKVVLVGDQMQLPPVFDQGAIKRSDKQIDISTLKNGGFGKIFDILPDSCKETLSTQYRMHPCIGDMISSVFYENKIQNGIRVEERTLDLPSFSNYAMLWNSTSNCLKSNRHEQSRIMENGKVSYFNPLEVKILLEYIKKLDTEIRDQKYSIGIITPYRAQLDLIQKRILMLNFNNITVEVNTVDAFQGSQKDIILYSTVRSSDQPKIGFLNEHSRLNVSFSRAKCLLIIVGDLDFLNNNKIAENKFPEIIKHMLSNQSFCHILQYRSDNH